MKKAAFIIGLLGLIVSFLMSVFYLIDELVSYRHPDLIGYSVSTILALMGIIGITLLNYNYKEISSKYSGILLLFFSGAYLLLYLAKWPFPELGLLFVAEASYMGPAILILYAGVPLMFIGAILYFIAARRMSIKK